MTVADEEAQQIPYDQRLAANGLANGHREKTGLTEDRRRW
jgi:hypothetical protein